MSEAISGTSGYRSSMPMLHLTLWLEWLGTQGNRAPAPLIIGK